MTDTKLSTDNRAIKTTVIIKQAMAVTGLFFVAFVILHAYGNLKVFLGEKDYNDYALALRTFLMPILPYEGLLWILRAVLLVCILVHVVAAFYLWHRSAKARGSRYMVKKSLATAYAARTVRWGGVILLFFILFHLGHFTLKWAKIGNPAAYGSHQVTLDAAGAVVPEGADSAVITVTEGYPYAMMYTTFSNWWMVLIYGIAVASLCLHIAHGVWSALQSVGWLRRNTEVPVQIISGLVGLAVLVMFLLPPVCFLAGLMPAPAPVA
ncbi:succinate dehydrogenase cytochrome b subunit [Mobiluncus mulieris]|uniref:Succinate dehydrogenase cytochrome b subunit n=1 Tax=Mobiluncus mulieris TaxID=2052 RepID=A0A7Y0U1B3_9ACTO|nr:succinate dehydrogenase cytochrome b subunit [Mobiluncus mulieris]